MYDSYNEYDKNHWSNITILFESGVNNKGVCWTSASLNPSRDVVKLKSIGFGKLNRTFKKYHVRYC